MMSGIKKPMSNPRIILWRGHHSSEFERLFNETWDRDDQLLIACPPVLHDFSFLDQLPPGDIFYAGQWPLPLPVRAKPMFKGSGGYPVQPSFGVFTTGTTRHVPKLILYSRENIESCQNEILNLFDRERIEAVFSYPQPYYVFGLTLGYAVAKINGWKLIAPHGAYGSAHHQAWFNSKPAKLLTLATPAHLSDLVNYGQRLGLKAEPTYSCILGGAKVGRDTWLAARDELHIEAPSIGYGCAEAAPGITHLAPGSEPTVDGEIGRPLAHLAVDIIKDEGIRFSGPSLCVATIENGIVDFPREMIVRDRVDLRPDGSMVFAARTDMLLNRGGEKFSLEHFESALRDILGIDSICVAVPDVRLGQELGVMIRSHRGVSKEQVFSTLEKAFGRRFHAGRFSEVAVLPLNDNSKPDRKVALDQLSVLNS